MSHLIKAEQKEPSLLFRKTIQGAAVCGALIRDSYHGTKKTVPVSPENVTDIPAPETLGGDIRDGSKCLT